MAARARRPRAVADGVLSGLEMIVAAAFGHAEPLHERPGGVPMYPDASNYPADFAHLSFEILRDDRVQDILASVSKLTSEHPAISENLLILGSHAAEALMASAPRTSPRGMAFFEDLLRVLDRFPSEAGRGPSSASFSARFTSARLGHRRPARPVLSLRYASLIKDPACSAMAPDLTRSRRVDYDRPRFFVESGALSTTGACSSSRSSFSPGWTAVRCRSLG